MVLTLTSVIKLKGQWCKSYHCPFNLAKTMEEVVKRKRGRPRKNPTIEPAPVAIKRPRGRPPKIVRDVIAAISDVVKIVEVDIVKKKRGRPPKAKQQTEATKPEPVKKDYNVISITDLEFWAETTDRDMFKQAVTDYNKIKKSKSKPEARWYKDRIEVVVV